MKHLGHIDTEGGPLLIVDADALSLWQGADGDGIDYQRACKLFDNALAAEVGFSVRSSRKRPLPENRRYLSPPSTRSSGKALRKRMREEVILTLVKE